MQVEAKNDGPISLDKNLATEGQSEIRIAKLQDLLV